MKKPLLAALMLTFTLGACGRLNPVNWFGSSKPAPIIDPVVAAETDPRPLIAQVVNLKVEPIPGGAIVRATGLPQTQGYWEAALLPRPIVDGVLVYDFRVAPPIAGSRVSTQASREVVVASSLNTFQLAGIRQIVVQGASNALTSAK